MKKQAIILFFISVFSIQFIVAQKISWVKNGLAWEHFKDTVPQNSINSSELYYFISYGNETVRYNDTLVERVKVIAGVDCNESWVKPDMKSDQLLKYNQITFNIVEFYRRKAQYEMNRIITVQEADSIYTETLIQCRVRIDNLRRMTDEGKNTAELQKWSNKIEIELAMYPKEEILPPIKPGLFSYGMAAGLAYGNYSGSLRDYYTGYPMFSLGFDIGIGKPVIRVIGNIGFSQLKQVLIHDGITQGKGTWVNAAIIEASIDYPLIQNSKHRLAPFLGYGVFENSFPEEDSLSSSMIDYRPVFGLVYDFRLKTSMKMAPMHNESNYRESHLTNLRVRFYMAPVDFRPDILGMSYNLSIGLSWIAGKFKVNNDLIRLGNSGYRFDID
jgi:hypothetical protein